MSIVSCRCGKPSWLGWPSGDLWRVPQLFVPVNVFRLRDLYPDAYRVGSPQRCVQKDIDTSDTSDLTVLWRSFGLHVAPNWFLCTDSVNDDTRIVFFPCGIPSRNFLCVCE